MKKKVNIGFRLLSIIIDQSVITLIILIFPLRLIGLDIANIFARGSRESSIMSICEILFFCFFILLIYFNKDIFNGRSIAKRIFKFQIIDLKTGKAASSIKCLQRNTTLFIWPIEIIFILINPERRLGDLIAGTQLIKI